MCQNGDDCASERREKWRQKWAWERRPSGCSRRGLSVVPVESLPQQWRRPHSIYPYMRTPAATSSAAARQRSYALAVVGRPWLRLLWLRPAVSQFSSAKASCAAMSCLPRLFGPAWRGLLCGVGVTESLNYSERAKLPSNDCCCPPLVRSLRVPGCVGGQVGCVAEFFIGAGELGWTFPPSGESCGVEARPRLSPGAAWRVGSGWESPSFHVARDGWS